MASTVEELLTVATVLSALGVFLFGSFSGEVLAGELDDVGRVVADDLLGEVLEDLWELLRHHDLLSRENSHFTYVGHLSLCSGLLA